MSHCYQERERVDRSALSRTLVNSRFCWYNKQLNFNIYMRFTTTTTCCCTKESEEKKVKIYPFSGRGWDRIPWHPIRLAVRWSTNSFCSVCKLLAIFVIHCLVYVVAGMHSCVRIGSSASSSLALLLALTSINICRIKRTDGQDGLLSL